jgi:hypothetical protein
LLIYEKSGFDEALSDELSRRWPASARVSYRWYRRDRLIAIARRSRACIYLSDCDRGPLALAEILLSGCPTVGVSRGAPWIVDGQTGFHVRDFRSPRLWGAIEQAMRLDRQSVCAAARARFDSGTIVQTILQALEAARGND